MMGTEGRPTAIPHEAGRRAGPASAGPDPNSSRVESSRVVESGRVGSSRSSRRRVGSSRSVAGAGAGRTPIRAIPRESSVTKSIRDVSSRTIREGLRAVRHGDGREPTGFVTDDSRGVRAAKPDGRVSSRTIREESDVGRPDGRVSSRTIREGFAHAGALGGLDHDWAGGRVGGLVDGRGLAEAFDDGGVGHASAFAHRLQPEAAAGALEFVDQRRHQTCT